MREYGEYARPLVSRVAAHRLGVGAYAGVGGEYADLEGMLTAMGLWRNGARKSKKRKKH